MKKTATIPSYSYEDTTHPNVKRFVDREGDWQYYWLVKEKRFVKGVTHILQLGYPKGARFHEYLLSVSKEEARKKLLEKGDEGTRTHSAIRQLIGGSRITMATKFPSDLGGGRQEPLNADEWDNLVAFEAFCARYKPSTVANEFTVYSTIGSGYAGTADYLCVLSVPEDDKYFPKEMRGKDVLALLDWKSSAAIYDEYGAQVAAYASADGEMELHEGFSRAFKGRIVTGVVRLGTRHKNGGYELKVWGVDETVKNLESFEAARTLADKAESIFEPEVEQVPSEFFIKVPVAVVDKPKAKTTKKKRAKVARKAQDELPLNGKQ